MIGLQCFNCMFVSAETEETAPVTQWPFDESCKYGNNPNKSLLKTCPHETNACGLIYIEGPVGNEGNHTVVQTILRSCYILEPSEELLQMCYPASKENILKIENLPELLMRYVGAMPNHTIGDNCVCNCNRCNTVEAADKCNGLEKLNTNGLCILFCFLFAFLGLLKP